MDIHFNEKGQAVAPASRHISPAAFGPLDHTEVTWLGGAGILINSRGSCLMIDPVLEGFDMPLLYEIPILPDEVGCLDALLITHIDNDHFSRPTCRDIASVCKSWHSTQYVAEQMREENLPAQGHDIGESFEAGNFNVKLTPADHNWQNGSSKYAYRYWAQEDYCGYWLDTPDGTIWLPGDSRLMECQLHMPQPDVILFDFADNPWHITLDGAVQLANAYPQARLLCIHWGSVDAPEMTPFNGNPQSLETRIVNPERICVLAPGEPLIL